MALTQQAFQSDYVDPIDIVEHLAEFREWEFDRVADDQIAMAVEGMWRTYSLTLAAAEPDETLRLICTFEMRPPEERHPALYETVNAANDQCWLGAFTYWAEQGLMVYRYALTLSGGQFAAAEQIERMIAAAIGNAERFYPAFQLTAWGGRAPADAMQVAMAEAYGRA
ncbi:diacylglyceryl transferase [Palleronia sediminis]|uniref:Diacylglyceryl transferase n=1 Tax=Palleronia sediminis TaxID=2547833 RepID=A0A4R6A284_9RHOB|nr:YbjN domain-containing protein [Palleronia sediminis]TDL76038.1 diacylglyceryl transferase [Palleronia sediminis]